MKTCPYCAEDIKDAAIRCRYCQTWLVDDIPPGADDARPPAGLVAASAATVGAGVEEAPPDMTEPMTMTSEPEPEPSWTDEGAAAAATTAGVAGADAAASETTAAPAAAAGDASAASAEPTPAATDDAGAGADTKIEFTHTGSRYLLGYGADYFGIWDRNAPQQPVERFPRNDQGWAAAWQRYAAMESNWMDLRTGQKSG